MNKNNISSVLLLFCALFSWSQTFNITGKVTDENGITLPYTNILLLKATDSTLVTGTTTDDNGIYLFRNIEPNDYLLKFSYIGFTDAYGTSIRNYMKRFSGYDTSDILADKKAKVSKI